MSLEPVKQGELQIGQPVPWALYDQDNRLLLAKGALLETESQLEQLSKRGLFRKLSLRASAELPATAATATRDAVQEELRPLEEFKLAIGDALQLQPQVGDGQLRYYVRLIGYLKGKGLVVTTPTQDNKVLLMREGQSFVVRMFSGKSVYAFSASIIKVANVPYPHLHLSYPAQVRGLVVRHGARARVALIAAVQDAQGTPHAATLGNLSIGGCSLATKAPIGGKGTRVAIKFRVAVSDAERYLNLEGVIRNSHDELSDDGATLRLVHGIQFADVAATDQLVLTAYVYQRLFDDNA